MLNNLKDRFLAIGKTLQETAPEEGILTAACSGDWDAALTMLEELERPMDRDAAELCLEFALQCASDEVFDRLLPMLPKGEYAGELYLQKVVPGQDVEAAGSLLMLAAAQGEAKKLQSLLAHGWDVNGASADVAQRLLVRAKNKAPYYLAAMSRAEPYSPRGESCLRVLPHVNDEFLPRAVHHLFPGATPLAAALLCGQKECVDILLAHGAWKEEAPSVARILALRDWESKGFQACRNAVLTYGEGPRPMALWAVVRYMLEEQLEEELRRCCYTDEAIAGAAWELGTTYRMMPNRGHWREERLRDFRRAQVLEKYYPQVLRRPKIVGVLLRQMFLQDCIEEWGDFLLTLCGEEVDLSLIREGFVRVPAKKARAFLLRLCEGRRCVMDRDSVPPTTPVMVLQTLISHVEFLSVASDRSVSGLTYAIFSSGNLQLIRKALQTGIIPAEEPAPLLLKCLGEIPWATTARTLLLTVPRLPQAEGGGWFEHRKQLLHGPGFRWMPESIRKEDYSVLLEDCPEPLERELVLRGLYDYRGRMVCGTGDGSWEADSPLTLLCWAGRDRVVERWLRCCPGEVLWEVGRFHSAGEDLTLKATPLCTAAFAGQKPVVETLLRHGAKADEALYGYPSTLICGDKGDKKEELPITPLLAAMIRGHWGMVQLLMDHGASCDTEQYTVQRLWRLHNEEDLHHAVQARLAGGFLQHKGGPFLDPVCRKAV